jgi:hypothetical protein
MKNVIHILDLSHQPNIIEEIMIYISEGHFQYKGFDIYRLEHPKLYGKWQIHRNGEFITRVPQKKDAESYIDGRLDFIKDHPLTF